MVTLDVSGDADVVADVTDAGGGRAALEAIGPVDILVNSAGIVGPNKPLWEVSDEEWAATFAVNVTGTFHMCRAVVPGHAGPGLGPDREPGQHGRARTAIPGSGPTRPPRPP